MNLLVCGGRDYNDYETASLWLGAYYKGHPGMKIVSGGARGADSIAERYAKENGIRFACYPADWEKNGKAAGYIRNAQMVEVSDKVVAFWDGKSRGTAHTISLAEASGIPVQVIYY